MKPGKRSEEWGHPCKEGMVHDGEEHSKQQCNQRSEDLRLGVQKNTWKVSLSAETN